MPQETVIYEMGWARVLAGLNELKLRGKTVMDDEVTAGRVRETTQPGDAFRTFAPAGRELSQAETEAALRDAFEQAQRTIGQHDPSDLLRAIANGYSDPNNPILWRLAEMMELDPCLAKLALKPPGDTEPIFTLRGRDKLAPIAVRHWAALASQHGTITNAGKPTGLAEKLQSAHAIAVRMDCYPGRRMPD